MTLTPERWQRIDELFAAALDLPQAERGAFLERECTDDPALLAEVLALLDAAAESELVLGESITAFADEIVAEVNDELARDDLAQLPLGGRIGPYQLLREIGRGGMGTVYLAERADAEFEKQVALKLVRRGLDTDEVLLRFRYERQILASLEHPHIARLYDGGATLDGRPYLVMEHIDGQPITQFCDDRRLTVEQRLQLFAQVCEAVQYAHRNLVVHRDIKPSNILVDAEGRPKLLDFGIARLLDPSDAANSPRTRTELRLLTPEYASPEQKAGAQVTTATDVYSLGLVLYELLAGRRPWAGTERQDAVPRPMTATTKEASAAGAAALRGTTPERLRRRLRGDLETIVMRALAVEPARRYPSADQLLDDIRRHLGGLPVHARGDSLRYRAVTFVRRHRTGVAAAALVLLSLVGGLGAALWQAQHAARQRDEARLERARAQEVSTFVLGLFESADPLGEQGGDTLRARALVDRGAERVRRELAGQPRLQAQMLVTLGGVYAKLGLYAHADELLGEALTSAARGDHARERADALSALADLAQRRNEFARLDSLSSAIIEQYDRAGWRPDVTYVNSISQRAAALDETGRSDEARAQHERAIAIMTSLAPERGGHHARLLNNLAVHHASRGDHATAEPLLREVVAIEERVYGPRHPHVGATLNNLASAVQYQGRLEEAEALYRRSLDIARTAYGTDHPYVGQFSENLATLLDDMGRHGEAEPLYREALRILTAGLGAGSLRVGLLTRNLALNRHSAGDYAQAESLLRSAARVVGAEVGADHVYTALVHASLGRTLTAAGRPSESLPLLRRSLELLEEGLPEGHWRVHAVRGEIGAALAALGRDAEAEPLLAASHEALRELKGDADYSTRDARRHLHRFYTARGDARRAAEFAEAQRPSRPQQAGM